MADIDCKIHLCTGERFRRVFIAEVCSGAIGLGQLTHQLGTGNSDVDDALHILFEDDLALEGRGRVIEVDDDILCAAHGFEGFAD